MRTSAPAMTVAIEELGRLGAELLSALHLRVFAEDTGERWRTVDLLEVLRLPGALCLFAVCEGTPRGYALLRFVADECELLSLGVDPGLRRCGIGRRLMDAVRARCRAHGTARLFLEVRESNLAARSFYRAQDFVEIGRRRNYYRRSCGRLEDAITMARVFTRNCSPTPP